MSGVGLHSFTVINWTITLHYLSIAVIFGVESICGGFVHCGLFMLFALEGSCAKFGEYCSVLNPLYGWQTKQNDKILIHNPEEVLLGADLTGTPKNIVRPLQIDCT